MAREILIKVGKVSLKAELFETPTAKALLESLPIESEINTWGDEFYFKTPVKSELDDTATLILKVGDIGFWPPDDALCIFFGPTPASSGSEPVPASEVNIVGKVLGDARMLKKAKSEKRIRLELTEQ